MKCGLAEEVVKIFFIYSPLVQQVERVAVNHKVVGSSPTGGAMGKCQCLQVEVVALCPRVKT